MKPTDPLNFRTSDVAQSLRMGVPNLKSIKFREELPMRLRDKVGKSVSGVRDKACLSEMMQLFTCLSKKDFETAGCPKEVTDLNSCWSKHLADQTARKQRHAQVNPLAGTSLRELTAKQVTSLLKKYPIQHLLTKAKK